jgi:hypothetical protein
VHCVCPCRLGPFGCSERWSGRWSRYKRGALIGPFPGSQQSRAHGPIGSAQRGLNAHLLHTCAGQGAKRTPTEALERDTGLLNPQLGWQCPLPTEPGEGPNGRTDESSFRCETPRQQCARPGSAALIRRLPCVSCSSSAR